MKSIIKVSFIASIFFSVAQASEFPRYAGENDPAPKDEAAPTKNDQTEVFAYWGYWCSFDGCGWSTRAVFASRIEAELYAQSMADQKKAVQLVYVDRTRFKIDRDDADSPTVRVGNETFKLSRLREI